MLTNELIIEPRFSEIDSMHVVHHSRYWIWFEEARFSFIQNVLGISLEKIKDSNLYMPVIFCECNYKHSIFWNDKIKIVLRLEFINYCIFKFQYEIFHYDQPNKIICTASTKQVFVDSNYNLKIKVPDYIVDSIQKAKVNKNYAFID